jgi:hypothetical protein
MRVTAEIWKAVKDSVLKGYAFAITALKPEGLKLKDNRE